MIRAGYSLKETIFVTKILIIIRRSFVVWPDLALVSNYIRHFKSFAVCSSASRLMMGCLSQNRLSDEQLETIFFEVCREQRLCCLLDFPKAQPFEINSHLNEMQTALCKQLVMISEFLIEGRFLGFGIDSTQRGY